jgi:hypothetical protein
MRRLLVFLSLLTAFLFATPGGAEAACTGTSPNRVAPTWNDVGINSRNCLSAVKNGDTITVSPGTYNVTTMTSVNGSRYFTLKLTGVTLQDNVTSKGNTDPLLAVTESTQGNVKIIGGTLQSGTGDHLNNGVISLYSAGSSGKPIIITGWNASHSRNFINSFSPRGVVYGNTFTGVLWDAPGHCENNAAFIRVHTGPSWATPPTYGSADTVGLPGQGGEGNVYVENNTILNALEMLDVAIDARVVFRFNKVTNSGITIHGDSDTGGRYVEIYKNRFIQDGVAYCPKNGNSTVNFNGFFNARAGTARIWGNMIPPVPDVGWGVKTPFFASFWNLARSIGPWGCWVGQPPSAPAGTVSYPGPHQVGWGYSSGATVVDARGYGTPACTFGCAVRQDIEALYLIGNTGGGNYDNLIVFNWPCRETTCSLCATRQIAATYIQADREFYNQIEPASNFTGASGTGYGLAASRPPTCGGGTGKRTAYLKTDVGTWNTSTPGTNASGIDGQGVIDICVSNSWQTAAYTPYRYPHPLAGDIAEGRR